MKKKNNPKKFSHIDFDLRQLEIFIKVVELRSFSRAADAVFRAQASVSERIATLESMMGTKLLDRLGRDVVPTRAGELLYKHALSLLEMKKNVLLNMKDFLGIKQGEIFIGGSTIPGEYILPGVLGRFYEKFPHIIVSLSIADTKKIEAQVLNGTLEFGVIGAKAVNKNLVCQKLWNDELVVAVCADHPWAMKKDVLMGELFQEPFVLREAGSGTLKILQKYFPDTGFMVGESFNVVARLGSSTAIKEGIKKGLGISIISSLAIAEELKAGSIKALRINGVIMTRTFYMIRDKRRSASPLCQALFDFLMEDSQVMDQNCNSA